MKQGPSRAEGTGGKGPVLMRFTITTPHRAGPGTPKKGAAGRFDRGAGGRRGGGRGRVYVGDGGTPARVPYGVGREPEVDRKYIETETIIVHLSSSDPSKCHSLGPFRQ
jgi:hypothetical protein